MTGPARRPAAPDDHRHDDDAGHVGGHAGHGWAMLICCIPMVIAFVVIVLGRGALHQ